MAPACRALAIRPRVTQTTDSTMHRLFTLGFLATFLACAGRSVADPVASSGASQGPLPSPCGDTVVVTPASEVRPPRPRIEPIPPARSAPHSGSYKVTIAVLPNGHVDPSRLAISPSLPPSYDSEFRKTVGSWRFWPATFHGCAVPGTFDYELRFF